MWNCLLQTDLRLAYIELGEVDSTMDDILGLVQQVEVDIADYANVYGDPLYIELHICKIEVS